MATRSLRSTLAAALSYSLLSHAPSSARAVCRVVEPVEIRGGVQFDPTTMVLYVLAPNQVVDYRCTQPLDAGTMLPDMPDASTIMDPDIDAGWGDDAGFEDDGGTIEPAADPDAPEPMPNAMPVPPPPDGACANGGAIFPVRDSVVHMVVQPSVLSTQGRAGLIMPVPARPDIHAPSDLDLFGTLGARLQPRVETTTEYIEDESLGYQCRDPKFSGGCMGSAPDDTDDFDPGPRGAAGDGAFYDPDTDDDDLQSVQIGDDIVSFERALVTADYDVTVVNASSTEALETWLDLNGFAHDAEDDAAFAAYVDEGAWFVALEVHPEGSRELAPLVVSFRSQSIPLMHRLLYDSAGGELVTEAFVMAPRRMDAADDSAETLYAAPAGFGGAVAGFGLSEGWLTHLRFDRATDEWLNDSRLSASNAGEVRPVIERIVRTRIPSSECPSRSDAGCSCSANAPRSSGPAGTWAPILLACLWIAARGRRRRA